MLLYKITLSILAQTFYTRVSLLQVLPPETLYLL